MARPPSITPPAYTNAHAALAALRIRALRAEAHDPDLDFFPTMSTRLNDVDIDDDDAGDLGLSLDEDDVDAVVEYVETHRRVPADILAAEMPHRAALVAYQGQRDKQRQKRRVRAVLEAGHRLHVPPRLYGRSLGLPTRQAVYARRQRLGAELGGDGAPLPGRQAAGAAKIDQWLAANSRHLLEVAEALVDHRGTLLELLPSSRQRRELAEAIDVAGEAMAPRASRPFAGAIAYAMFLLRPDGSARPPADPLLREMLNLGATLRAEYNDLRDDASA